RPQPQDGYENYFNYLGQPATRGTPRLWHPETLKRCYRAQAHLKSKQGVYPLDQPSIRAF
ncbi:MAG: hypothetical protein ACO3TX_08080, partial [Pseudomonadales bacterium]